MLDDPQLRVVKCGACAKHPLVYELLLICALICK